MKKHLITFLTLSVFCSINFLSAAEEIREWRNTDGSKSFKATYVSLKNNIVTLTLSSGKEISFPTNKLHKDDQKWLKDKITPKLQNVKRGTVIKADKTKIIFDTLTFEDTKEVVMQKLDQSKIIKPLIAKTMMARTGMNGVFALKQKISNQNATLFFKWKNDTLTRLTVRSERANDDVYQDKLEPYWNQIATLITALHGKPAMKTKFPPLSKIKDNQIETTHYWQIRKDLDIYIGIGKQGRANYVTLAFYDPS